nr:hypothetical protein [Tanacetum cinerariifolium]
MMSLADKAILSGADNRPPMLEKDMYDSWKSIMELYMLNRQHGRMILESVKNGPLLWPTVEENGDLSRVIRIEFLLVICTIMEFNETAVVFFPSHISASSYICKCSGRLDMGWLFVLLKMEYITWVQNQLQMKWKWLLEWKEVQDQNNVIISPNTQINKLRMAGVSEVSLDNLENMELIDKENMPNDLLALSVSELDEEEYVDQPLSIVSSPEDDHSFEDLNPSKVNFTVNKHPRNSEFGSPSFTPDYLCLPLKSHLWPICKDLDADDVVPVDAGSPLPEEKQHATLATTNADSNSMNSDDNSVASADVSTFQETELKNSDHIETRQPERLPLTRKVISPNSQEKLCQAMKSTELPDDRDLFIMFWSACPRNDLMTEGTYALVEILHSNKNWEPAYDDDHWCLKFKWSKPSKLSTRSYATIEWEISDIVVSGVYRIMHFGTSKSLFGSVNHFTGSSAAFTTHYRDLELKIATDLLTNDSSENEGSNLANAVHLSLCYGILSFFTWWVRSGLYSVLKSYPFREMEMASKDTGGTRITNLAIGGNKKYIARKDQQCVEFWQSSVTRS